MRSSWFTTLFLWALMLPAAQAGTFRTIYVFGDSMVDRGNALISKGVPVSPPYADGRWTNGGNMVTYIAQELGVGEPGASLKGGRNFAYGAAFTGTAKRHQEFVEKGEGIDVPDIGEQIAAFRTTKLEILPCDLVIVIGGFNDLMNGDNPTISGEELASHIQELYHCGARKVFTMTLAGKPMSGQFNKALLSKVEAFEKLPGINIKVLRFDQKAKSFSGPALGFTNVTEPACPGCGDSIQEVISDPNVVPNPGEYLFWDEVHLTTAAHKVMAQWSMPLIDELALPPGDFDGDGDLTDKDRAMLTSAVAKTTEFFDYYDLNSDGIVDSDDLVQWNEAKTMTLPASAGK